MKRVLEFRFIWAPLSILFLGFLYSLITGTAFAIPEDYFDAVNYRWIATEGYHLDFLTAYFPGFPFIWSLFNGALLPMVFVNGLLWFASMILLRRYLPLKSSSLLVASVMPGVLFFFLPYSESLFFFLTALIAIGVHRRSWALILTGMLFAAMTRPTSAVLVPAVGVALFLKESNSRNALLKTSLVGVIGLIGVFFVLLIQSAYTGSLWSFFNVQNEHWGNGISFPKLPFYSWGGDLVTMIDGTSLFIGLAAGVTLVRTIGSRRNLRPVHYFGFAGLFFTALLVIFTRGGGIFSLNRFILATAFFPIALDGWSRLKVFRKDILIFGIGWILTSLAVGSYLHFQAILVWLMMGGIVATVFVALSNRNVRTITVLGVILFTSYWLIHFVLREKWIG